MNIRSVLECRSAFRPCTPCSHKHSEVRQPAVELSDQDWFPAIPDSSVWCSLRTFRHAARSRLNRSKSARSLQLECEYTNCLIKPGPPRTQTRRQDTLTTLDRKRNTKNTAGALPLARVLPGTSRSRSCNAYGRSKEAGNLAQACTQGWPVSSLYCKTNGTCYMRQIISTIFLLYFEEDWYFNFSFDHSPKRQGEKSGAVKSGHIY